MKNILVVTTTSGRLFLSTEAYIAKLVAKLQTFDETLESVTEVESGSEIILGHWLRTFGAGESVEIDRTEEFM
jgi:hypothetical protein